MFNNKKIRNLVAVIATVLVISTGCGNAADNGKDNANSTPPAENVGQNDSSTNPNDENNVGDAEDQNDANDSEAKDPADTVESAEPGETTAASIANKITSEVQTGTLLTLSADEVKDLYGIDPDSLLADGVFMPAMMNVHSTEITVVELKSEENYDAVVAAMEKRAANIQKTFEQYLPDQYENALNYQIIRNGNYVLFSITHDQAKVAEIFNSFFAK